MLSPSAQPVGPVLSARVATEAVRAAIRRLNPGAEIVDRGSYVRVLSPGRCVLTRAALEEALGRAVDLRGELEGAMPSFAGRLALGDDEAVWSAGPDQ